VFISKRPSGYYYLFFTDELGRRHTKSTRANTKSEALKFLQKFSAIDIGQGAPLRPISLPEFSARYIEYARAKFSPKYVESIRTSLSRLQRVVGDVPLSRVGVFEVEQFLSDIARGSSDRTSRAYFVTCASALETARRWEYIELNPFRKVRRPKLRELIPMHIALEEFPLLLAAEPDPMLRDLYAVAVSTGLRLGELAALHWGDVDFTQKVVRVRNSDTYTTKNKRNRVVPMTDRVCELLRSRKCHSINEYVFSRDGKPITKDIASRNFKQCVVRAGLNPALHFHSLRHSFATWLVQAGVSIYAIQKLLGHSSISMTQIYAHLAPSELHDTVNRIRLDLHAVSMRYRD
jgi:site-specific recombinase XerD